jgi:hypothetical protein
VKKFTSIGQYRNVVKTVTGYYNKINALHKLPTLNFVGTVKLHGTNAGLRRVGGVYQAQSREQLISVGKDNAGFAAFIHRIPTEKLDAIFDKFSTDPDADITLYGEWVGKGIQSTVAVTELDKHWVLFKAAVNDQYVDFIEYKDVMDHAENIYNIYEIPVYKVAVDFKKPEQTIPEIERITLAVEEECPWGKKFGVVGIGEGVVWGCVERPSDTELFFKTKGVKHSNSKVKKVASVDIERVNSINALVDTILPNGRLEQGIDVLVNQMHLDIDPANMGSYMKWIANDILKEESDTITENGFVWAEVVKIVNNRARTFFFSKMSEF